MTTHLLPPQEAPSGGLPMEHSLAKGTALTILVLHFYKFVLFPLVMLLPVEYCSVYNFFLPVIKCRFFLLLQYPLFPPERRSPPNVYVYPLYICVYIYYNV